MIEAGAGVKIKYNGKAYNGYVKGVKTQFPSVYVPSLDIAFEYSRQALQRAIDNKTILTT